MQELVSESLQLVGEELAVTLNDVRNALELYADGDSGPEPIDNCVALLHAANGALRVTETYGASLLAEEMEGTCRHLGRLRPDDARSEEALEALSRAAVQLPAYVEQILNGGRDIPLVLLPLLNDLRAARGRPLLSESTLLLLNIGSADAMPAEPEVLSGSGENMEELARKLRPGFQLALLGWIRGDDPVANLTKIGEVAERMERAATSREVHQLWWVVGGVVEALLEGGLDTSVSLKRLIGQADRELKRLPTVGEDTYQETPPTELVNNFLYYIARSTTAGLRVGAIRAAFNLSGLVPGNEQVAAARESLAAPSPKLMTTVAQAIRDDLARVKDVLDIYVRTGMQHVDELAPQIELLKKIGDTLGVLGLGELRETIQVRRGELQKIIDSGRPVEEAVLLEMASALLHVEDHLDEALFGLIRPPESDAGAGDEKPVDAEFDQVAQAVMRECGVNLSRIKESIALVLERPNEAALLDSVPVQISGIMAGLMILEKEAAVSIVEEVGELIGELLESGYDDVDRDQIDLLADAIVSVEYYLETLQNGRKEPVYMLDNARACLSALRETGLHKMPKLGSGRETSGLTTTMQIPDLADTQVVAATQVITDMPVMAEAGAPVDPELIELYIEEAGEEIATITKAFPAWEQNEAETELLSTIRRSFHTLKGSGRMVGAELIGEFSWRFEDLLNRLINGTLERTPEIVDCVGRGIAALPELLEQLESGSEPEADIDALMQEAVGLTTAQPAPAEFAEPEAAQPPGDLPEAHDAAPDDAIGRTGSVRIDPALMEILSKETGTHLEAILEFVEAAADRVPPYSVTEEMHRACHTLHGSVTMANAAPAAVVTGPLNQMVRRAYDRGVPLEETAIAACADAIGVVADIISQLEQGDANLPETSALQTRLVEIDAQIEAAAARAEEEDVREQSILPGADVEDTEALAALEDVGLTGGQDADDGTGDAAAETAKHPVTSESPAGELQADDASMPGGVDPEVADIFAEDATVPPAEVAPADDDFDPEIAEIFAEEAAEILEAIDAEMAQADDGQLGETQLGELQRHLHTLKGGARLAGLMAMGDLSHDLETLLVRQAGGALEQTPEQFGVLRAVVDELHRMREEVDAGVAPVAPPELQRRLAAALGTVPADAADMDAPSVVSGTAADSPGEVAAETEETIGADDTAPAEPAAEEISADGELSDEAGEEHAVDLAAGPAEAGAEALEGVPDVAAADPDAPEPDEQVEAAADTSAPDEPVHSGRAIPAAEHLGELARALEQPPVPEARDLSELVQRPAATRERRELARVDPMLLENLLNNAGEVSIFHSRLTQQVGQVQFNLEELGQTVIRLREQLRNLEMATEAQIIYQHQADKPAGDETDPLTLERYSKIQQLSRSLAESASDVSSLKDLLQNLVGDTEALLVQQARTAAELQDGLMRTRMVGFRQQGNRLERLARQTGTEQDKQVELTVYGSGEIDRQVLEKMMPPLEHMVRNAVIHGIETPDERTAAGKPQLGRINLSLRREGAQVVIDLSDDGRGMDVAAIRHKAIELGMCDTEDDLADEEILQFVLRPGFSTADRLTHAAGRGVGMDVVASEIARLGGTLHIDTQPGAGTTFAVRLPFTLAVTQALIVRAGPEMYALPLPTVEGIIRISRSEYDAKLTDPDPHIEYGGRHYQFRHLGPYLGLGPARIPEEQERVSVVLVQAGSHSTALVADEMLDSREIVVKPIGGQLSTIRGISGATILGDGRIVIILDIASLVRSPVKPVTADDILPEAPPDEPLALVVDDSITMRRVTQRLLERHGIRVVTAKDGVEAIATMRERTPDIILLDVEMPRMDGYEFAAHVRGERETAGLPIIMITSRVSDKHKARAIELGVNDYLGKPYQEAKLLEAVNELLPRRATARSA